MWWTRTWSPEAFRRLEARARRRILGLGTVCALLCGMLWDGFPLPDERGWLAEVPARGAGFAARDLPLRPWERAALGSAGVLHRRYDYQGHYFFLTVIDGTRNRHAIHDPHYCFEGAGWRLRQEERLAIPGGTAAALEMAREGTPAHVIFWFSDGGRRRASMFWYWWQTTVRRLTLGRYGAEPLLVVLQSGDQANPDWPAWLPGLIGALRL